MMIETNSLTGLRDAVKTAHQVWLAEEAKLPQGVQDPDKFGLEVHEQFTKAFDAQHAYHKAVLTFAAAVEALIQEAEPAGIEYFPLHLTKRLLNELENVVEGASETIADPDADIFKLLDQVRTVRRQAASNKTS